MPTRCANLSGSGCRAGSRHAPRAQRAADAAPARIDRVEPGGKAGVHACSACVSFCCLATTRWLHLRRADSARRIRKTRRERTEKPMRGTSPRCRQTALEVLPAETRRVGNEGFPVSVASTARTGSRPRQVRGAGARRLRIARCAGQPSSHAWLRLGLRGPWATWPGVRPLRGNPRHPRRPPASIRGRDRCRSRARRVP